jgi:class 3 adenylate cyclase/DNA-binding SARP family transcriptional activator
VIGHDGAPVIEIRLLGRFSVRRSGEEVPPGAFGGRLARSLVRLLVTQRGRFVSLDTLTEALWPTRPPADPAANLRILVKRARGALGDAAILTEPGGYSFAAGEDCLVDTERFLAAAEAGRQHVGTGQMGAALREFRRALDLWGGEPLPEDAYEEWAQEPRAMLMRVRLQALEDGAGAALALRDPTEAAALAELAVAQEPLREPATVLLARALAASGDSVAALRAIDTLRRRLAEEVGMPLSVEAIELETSLQRGDAAVAGIRPSVIPRARPAFEGLAFVGREDELDAVLAASAMATTEPEPPIVLVAGSAGAGKSRLLSETAARAGIAVLSTRAFLPERNEPWGLARSLLREVLALDLDAAQAVPDRAADALADVLPEIVELRPVRSVTVDPESRRALALEAAVRLTAAAAAKGALVIADDLQWADATSLAFLGMVARRVHGAALVLAYRPEDVVPDGPVATFLEELRSQPQPVIDVPVGPLSPETISALISDPELARTIASETDRTPLAVVEVIRGLTSQGVIEPDVGGRFQTRTPEAHQAAAEIARSGQRRAIQTRSERQPAGRRQTLGLLALLGRETPARIVAQARNLPQPTVLDELDLLARAGLARLGDGGWATAHDLIGEVVADGLERSERGRLHQLLAQALDDAGGDRSEVARHLAGAGDRAAATLAYAAAASEALDRFAADETRQLADSGLALDPEPSSSGRLLRTRAEARALRGDLPGARDDLRVALTVASPGPDHARVLARIADLTGTLVGFGPAAEMFDIAITEAGGDALARAEILAAAAIVDVSLNEMDRAAMRADEALALFERLGDPSGVASILDVRAGRAFLQGHLPEAADLYGRTARLYRDAGRLLRVGTVQSSGGVILAFLGRTDEALAAINEALELERTLGQREGEAICTLHRSQVFYGLGRADEALADATTGLELSRSVGSHSSVAWGLMVLAQAHEIAGEPEQAEAKFRESVEAGSAIPWVASWAFGRWASFKAGQGDHTVAEDYANRALRAGVGFAEHEARLVLAEVALLRGDPDAERRAVEALDEAEANGYRYGPTHQRLLDRAMQPSPRPRQEARSRREHKTFMFTDIVGSTTLLEAVGDTAWDHLLRWHDQTLRSLFAAHGGTEINRIGDGFFVAFDRADAAVRCAVEIQRALARHRVDHGFAPGVRIGLHEAEATREGSDYQGRGVHEAARIAGAAQGDEILVSAPVAARAEAGKLSGPKAVHLKGLSRPVDVFTVDWR